MVVLPMFSFPSTSQSLFQHAVDHCHAAKSLYRSSHCVAIDYLFMLVSDPQSVFDNEWPSLCHLVSSLMIDYNKPVLLIAEHELGHLDTRLGG